LLDNQYWWGMLNSRYSETGFSLIELMVGITIVGILFIMGVPSFKSWIQNAQIHTATEAIQNGLELARAEAVRRNTLVRFQLTSTVDNSCVLTTASSNWVVSLDDPTTPTALCANAKLNETFPVSDTFNNPPPRIIQVHPGSEGSANAVVASKEVTPAGVVAATPVYNGSITFNGMGRISAAPASVNPGNNVQIDITNPVVGGTCISAGGPMRCLRIVISSGGLIRSCNPVWSSDHTQANYDPQGC
jgi:type IV fimbrial biogenesis protein FimT